MPRSFSISIQSEVACTPDFLPFTVPAMRIRLPYNSTFSVMVVLPASGWEMMAKVRRLLISSVGLIDSSVCVGAHCTPDRGILVGAPLRGGA